MENTATEAGNSKDVIVDIRNVTKKYGNFCAVNDISLQIYSGEIFGFLGVNGAGKTTTLKMLAGVLQPSAGDLSIAGHSLNAEPIEAKRITGYIPDRPYLYAKLTAREFLYFVADLYSVEPQRADQRIAELLKEYGLTSWQDELIDSFSHGMKQRLATCAALIHEPRLLIVDEPMVGLDPHGAKLLKDAFRRYSAAGCTVFLSTHSLNVAEEVCHRLAIIDEGKIQAIGTLDEIHALTGRSHNNLESLFLELTAAGVEYST